MQIPFILISVKFILFSVSVVPVFTVSTGISFIFDEFISTELEFSYIEVSFVLLELIFLSGD